METIRKRVGELFSEAIKKQPSIVFLDDVDILATNDQKESVSVGDPIRSRQIAEIIVDWMRVITDENHRVVCVMALQHAAAVNQLLLRPHVFGKQIQIQPPNLEARIKIMKKIMTRKGIDSSSIDLQSVAINCEGYLGVDLEMLVERAVHVASTQFIEKSSLLESTDELAKKLQNFLTHGGTEPNGLPNGHSHALTASTDSTQLNGDSLANSVDGLANSRTGSSASASLAQSEAANKVALSTNDLLEAQKGFTPASLKGIKLHKSSVSWQDIGGEYLIQSTIVTLLTACRSRRSSLVFKANAGVAEQVRLLVQELTAQTSLGHVVVRPSWLRQDHARVRSGQRVPAELHQREGTRAVEQVHWCQ